MLDTLIAFVAEIGSGEKRPDRFEANDYRLAAAAILVHIVAVDGEIAEAERGTLHEILSERFGLDAAETAELITAATAADREAVGLYQFTRVLMRALDEEHRKRIVEMMWQIVYADGHRSEFEDNIVWRAADLLGISPRDRIALRRRVVALRDGNGDT
jgi:uncharacterized tellurite resistance protein B-like protein